MNANWRPRPCLKYHEARPAKPLPQPATCTNYRYPVRGHIRRAQRFARPEVGELTWVDAALLFHQEKGSHDRRATPARRRLANPALRKQRCSCAATRSALMAAHTGSTRCRATSMSAGGTRAATRGVRRRSGRSSRAGFARTGALDRSPAVRTLRIADRQQQDTLPAHPDQASARRDAVLASAPHDESRAEARRHPRQPRAPRGGAAPFDAAGQGRASRTLLVLGGRPRARQRAARGVPGDPRGAQLALHRNRPARAAHSSRHERGCSSSSRRNRGRCARSRLTAEPNSTRASSSRRWCRRSASSRCYTTSGSAAARRAGASVGMAQRALRWNP